MVWQTKEAKYKQLLLSAERSIEEGRLAIVSYYFKSTRDELCSKVGGDRFMEIRSQEDFTGKYEGKPLLVKSELLKDDRICSKLAKFSREQGVAILFAEHYPLYAIEKEIEDAWSKVESNNIDIRYFVSLDEAFIEKYVGNKLKDLLVKMGLDPNECISHTYVDKSIANIQEKINKKIAYELRADSIESWLSKNLPTEL